MKVFTLFSLVMLMENRAASKAGYYPERETSPIIRHALFLVAALSVNRRLLRYAAHANGEGDSADSGDLHGQS